MKTRDTGAASGKIQGKWRKCSALPRHRAIAPLLRSVLHSVPSKDTGVAARNGLGTATAGRFVLQRFFHALMLCEARTVSSQFVAGRVGAPAKVRRFLIPVREPDTALPLMHFAVQVASFKLVD